MKNFKTVLFILLIILVILFFTISNYQNKSTNKQVTIGVTTFALYDIVKHIATEGVNVVNILPFGVDPHSFEPTPKLMIAMEKSALVFYSGAGLEPWIANFNFKHKAVNISKFVDLQELAEDEHEPEEHHHSHESGLDPHYWLDFDNMKKASTVITDELIKVLPQNRELYLKNEAQYLLMLKRLDEMYKTKLSKCENDTVIMSHNALGYVAKRYDFKVESLTGLSPESEPSAQDINRIFRHIKKDGIDTIFFENFVNEKLITNIAKDAKIKLELFEPLGTITADEAKVGLTYEDIMKTNLQKLAEALKCQ